MNEYLQSRHMELILPTADQQPIVYLPHHHVYKPPSTISKLHMIFNGSCILYKKRSFNDFLHKGPNYNEIL